MPVRDHDPISFNQFLGTFDRGEEETTPPGYFNDSQNVAFSHADVHTREGSGIVVPTTFNIRRIAIYKRIGEAPRLLILDDAARLWDSTNLSLPILTIGGMSDFSMVSMFNRAYITPHTGIVGIPGSVVYVYEGSGTARPAGGTGPSGAMTGTEGVTGPMDKGVHAFAVAFETASGHLTQIGAYLALNLTGNLKVNLANIPIGPTGTVARVIVATKNISTTNVDIGWDGDFLNKTYYYVPDGRIGNNAETTRTVSFYDADLQAEASHLVDQLSTIPAGVGINIYRGRLIVWGENANPSIVRVSQAGFPESFDAVEGFTTINPGDSGGGVKYCFEYRTQLICCKSQRSYITMDNGNSAALWEVNALDKSVGTECHGVGKILDFGEDVRDRAFICDRSGLQLYVGTFSDTEISGNISDIWDRINKAQFHKVEIAVDPLEARIYICVPLDNATDPSHMIVGDWQDGLSLDSMKFTLWKFPFPPSTVVVDVRETDKESFMKFGSMIASGVDGLDRTAKLDRGQAIDSWVEFPLLPQGDDWPVNHFTGFRARLKGVGNLDITLSGLDDVQTAFVPSLALSPTPGKPLFRGFNFTSERCSVKLRTSLANEWFLMSHFSLFYKQLWQTRPE
jgi:hypothetical protein